MADPSHPGDGEDPEHEDVELVSGFVANPSPSDQVVKFFKKNFGNKNIPNLQMYEMFHELRDWSPNLLGEDSDKSAKLMSLADSHWDGAYPAFYARHKNQNEGSNSPDVPSSSEVSTANHTSFRPAIVTETPQFNPEIVHEYYSNHFHDKRLLDPETLAEFEKNNFSYPIDKSLELYRLAEIFFEGKYEAFYCLKTSSSDSN